MELIPAIDLIEGKCVRLTQGDYSTQKVYNITCWNGWLHVRA